MQTDFLNHPPRPALVPKLDIAPPQVGLNCGSFGLLIPAEDLVSLIAPQQITQTAGDLAESLGSVIFQDQSYPVFCLNTTLQLQPHIDAAYTTLALLRTGEHYLGIVCHSFIKLASEQDPIHALPPSMKSRRQPFTEFRVIDNRIWGLSSAAALVELLATRGLQIKAQQTAQAPNYRGANA